MALKKKHKCFISKCQKFSNIKSFNFPRSFPSSCMACPRKEGGCIHIVASFEEGCNHTIAGLEEGCSRFVPRAVLMDLEPGTMDSVRISALLSNPQLQKQILLLCNPLATRSNETNAQWPLWELISLI